MKKLIVLIMLLAFILVAPFSVLAEQTYINSDILDEQEHLYSALDATAPAAPNGWLDSVSITSISGWAWRSDIPNTPIKVHVYIRNSSGQDVSVSVLTANQYRSDLA